MTIAARRTRTATVAVRVRSAIQAMADRIHSAPDRRAAAAGLTVTRVGLTGRAYRDPRFNTRRNRGE